MKHPPADFSHFYQVALCSHLDQGSQTARRSVEDIGVHLRAAGVTLLDLAKLHERILVMELLPDCPVRKKTALIRNAANFFAAVIAEGKNDSLDASRLRKTIESLSGRTVELASANHQLALEIIQRKKVETELRKSEQNVKMSLEKAELLKEQLRGLSRQILSVQEEERKKISRELHDVVAQALMGINVRLANLKKESGINSKGLERNITKTQKMITKSADIVHQFARELRPAVLDDLGLIPALQSFMKNFTTRTGVRTHLTVFEDVEKLNAAKRVVLYRVAQEALTNVSRHARASRVDVTIRREAKCVLMEVSDDGCSFQIQRIMKTAGTKRLGILGMRERIEMVGGFFDIESSPGQGTKVIARIPVNGTTERKRRSEPVENQP